MTAAEQLHGIGSDIGKRLADEVIGSEHLPGLSHAAITELLERRGLDVLALLRPHLSEDDVVAELDAMAAAYWQRFDEVGQALRHHPPGTA